MSIDVSNSKEVEANFFDENALFTLWFYSINFCFSRAGICRDNQSTVYKEKAENANTGRIDKPDTSGPFVKEDPSTSGADKKKSLDIG